MNLINLKSEPISRSSLESTSTKLTIKLKEIESYLLQKYEISLEWLKLTEEQNKEYKVEFLKSLSFYKISYPKDQPFLIANAKDGDFEYSYELTVIEDISLNAKIDTKINFGELSSAYLFRKEKDEEKSFVFLYERFGESGERTDNIIVVEY